MADAAVAGGGGLLEAHVGTLALLGTGCSLLVMLSPLPELLMSRSVDTFPLLPILTMLVNCALWLLYGIAGDLLAVQACNGLGLGLACSYLLLYYRRTEHPSRVLRRAFLLGLLPLLLLPLGLQAMPGALTHKLGLCCTLLSVINYAAPLSAVREVLRTRTARGIPVLLACGSLVASVIWTAYGVGVSDVFVTVPSVLGMGICSLQVGLILRFGRGPPVSPPVPAPASTLSSPSTSAAESMMAGKAGGYSQLPTKEH